MTAPMPDRAAIRPLSVTMPEIRDCFSPETPMQATWTFFLPKSLRMASSVSMMFFPQRSPASLISMDLSVMSIQTGLSAAPVTNIASYPVFFMARDKNPPELASPQPPVKGDFPTTMYRPEKKALVPVKRPEQNPR